MKLFLIRLFVFLLLQFAIGYVLISKGMESDQNENHFYAAMLDKERLLAEPGHDRVILIGGSNVAFGFECSSIQEKKFARPINAGLHAGFGLFLPLNFVEDHVSEGDTVILAFEYELLSTNAMDGDPAAINELIRLWPNGKKYTFGDFDWKRFLDRDALDLVHYWVDRGRRRLGKRQKTHQIDSEYQRVNFNDFGDMVGHHAKQAKEWKGNKLVISEECLNRSINRLNKFQKHCAERKVAVFLTYPPMASELYESRSNVHEHIHNRLSQELDIPIINTPAEMTFETSRFYDTMYHLDQKGAALRTQRVLAGLESQRRMAENDAQVIR